MTSSVLGAVCVSLLLSVVTGQRDACSGTPLACAFDTSDFAAKQWDGDAMDFSPSLPGAYTFTYEASDLCNSVSKSVTVNARCPAAPVARISSNSFGSDGKVLQGSAVTANGATSSASYTGGSIVSYKWYIVQAPAASPLITSVFQNRELATSASYSTDSLQIAGTYQLKLVVSDGCSTGQAFLCFTVQCGCGPTANAGATSTIWTNTPASFNSGTTSSGSNLADNNNGPSFTLDGSLSYDFDTSSGLTYDWSFQEWVQILDGGNQRVWTPTTSVTDSAGRGSMLTYTTVCTQSTLGTTLSSQCDFKGIPSASAGTTDTGATTQLDVSPFPRAVTSTPSGFPRKCPAYVGTEYEFATPTTQMNSQVGRSVINATTVTKYTQRVTQTLPSDVTASTYCSITVAQQIAAGLATARNNPVASLKVSNLKSCRGLWSFKLVVTDGCGATTASSDTIKVTVRCNEPPIAVLCCNNTQMWSTQFQRFQQVRLDGRGSDDPDVNGGALTYTWSFLSSPSGFCGASGYTHQVCDEPYCNNANGFTQISTTGSPTFRTVFGGSAGVTCGPTVYPIIRDRTIAINQPCSEPNPNGLAASAGQTYCQYQAIAPTGYHVGNSAYFTPSTRGTYQIQLQVSDGCSTTTDTVFIVAECPVLSATAARVVVGRGDSTYTISKAGSAAATLDLEGVPTYAGDAAVLAFGWSAGQGAPGAVSFSAPTSKVTTASFNTAGVYNLLFSVTDKCQTVFAALPAITVTCNAPPQGMNLAQVVGTGNSVLYSGSSFGPLRVRASAIDSDALTYSFTLVGSTLAGVSTGAEFEFTPIASGQGNQTFTVNSVASDGCSLSSAATILLRADCKAGLTPRATIGTGRGAGSSTIVEYDPTASNKLAFPTVTVDASSSVWPYDGVPGAVKVYQWAAGLASSGGVIPGSITFQGQGTTTLVLTPTVVGAHSVILTVNDGCQSGISVVSFDTRCSTIATAAVTASPGTGVVWDSFKSASAGGFPSVTLNGSTSTGYVGMELSYSWAVAPGNAVPVQFGNTVGAVTTFTPSKGATYGFVLTVQNGPCPVSSPAVVTITATCNTLVAVLRQGPTLAASGQGTSSQASVALESRWDGSKFPTVELDGTDLTYTQSGGRGSVGAQQSGNLRSLKYTWNVVQSPICSCYGQENGPNNTVTSSAETPKAPTLVSQNNASLVINDVSWTSTSITSTVTTTTTLANHHYLLPHTCLKPDCAGAYKVVLTVDDGCTTAVATATINAFCGTAPVVSIDASAAGTQKLQGTKFTRMTLVASVAGSDFSKETLSYQWSLLQIPAGSRLKTGSYESITNGQMPSASFVPDRAGVYIVQFSADDGCNPPATTTSLFTVQCASTLAIASANSSVAGSATPDEIKWMGGANAAANMNNFGNKIFSFVGKVSGTCNTLSTRWRLISRTCTDPTDITVPVATTVVVPAATCTRCPLNCSWALSDTPCTNTSLNRGYIEPVLTVLNNATDLCKDKITFKPQYPGTYTLMFTVADCCGTSSSSMKVVAKCQTGIKANVGSTTVNSLFACQTSGAEDWQTHTLQGNPIADPNSPAITSVASCPVAAALPSCANKPANCCPAANLCCGAFKCPQCPQCAQCPQCPGYTSATSGSADFEYRVVNTNEINAFTAQAEAMANEPLSKASFITGIIAPVGAMIMVSMIANVVMLILVRSRKDVDLPY